MAALFSKGVDQELEIKLVTKCAVEYFLNETPVFIGKPVALQRLFQQFIGKPYGRLVITGGESDQYIQAITGATISSAAVAQSVRAAVMSLEKAVGGFEEDTQ